LLKTGLIIGVIAGSTAGMASAQTTDMPVRRIDIGLGAQLDYDSNVLRSGSNVSGRGKDDIIASPTLNTDILLPFSRNSLYLNGTLAYRFYRHHTELNREAINLNGGGELRLGQRCAIDGDVSWRRQQTDLGDIYDALDPKNTEQSLTESARASCNRGLGFAPSAGVTHRTVTNSAQIRKENNFNVDTVDVALGYSRPLFGTIAVYGIWSDATYPDRIAIAPGANDGTRTYQLGVRYERDIGTRLRGKVSLGWSKVNPKLAGVPGFQGLFYSTDITALVNERLQLAVSAARTVEQSNLLSISYSITDMANAEARYAFSPLVRLVVGATWTRRNLHRSPAVLDPVFVPDDRLWDLHARLSFRHSNRLSFGLDASYRDRQSRTNFDNYNSFRAGISAQFTL